jgi:hypothetical protein
MGKHSENKKKLKEYLIKLGVYTPDFNLLKKDKDKKNVRK